MSEIRPSQLLRSRGWRPLSKPTGIWEKRGWVLPTDSAYALEEIMERECGAVTPRNEVSDTEVGRLRRLIENPVWGLQ